ncbi:MAG: hydroxymethylbilane synthase [Eubacterium sp.]|nr:hydroxymethylbilane synthase [Eubacterium sp.]
MNKIRIGTRGSKLALKQAAFVQEALRQADSEIETEIVVVHTKGDKMQDKPFIEIGDKGVFASELEQALQRKEIDLAVHSAKDLPMELAEGLTIAAVLPRGDVRDVLVIPEDGRMPVSIGNLIKQTKLYAKENEIMETSDVSGRRFVIGTSSRRRQQQAARIWENVVCVNIRGNVDTRLRKLKDGGDDGTVYDGIIVAKAGLDRLEVDTERKEGFLFYPLPPEQFLPAACQGIIAVETRQDSAVAALCRELNDSMTELCFAVEREVLARLAADCSEAAAAWCRWEREGLTLDVMYADKRERLVCTAVLRMGETEAEREEQLRAGLALARKAAELVKRGNV